MADGRTLIANVMVALVLPWLAGQFMRQRAELIRSGSEIADRQADTPVYGSGGQRTSPNARALAAAEQDGHMEPVPPAIRHSGMMRLLAAGLGLALLTACSPAGCGGQREVGPHVPAVGERDDTSSSRRSVADYFSPPQPYPGPTWAKGGRPVDARELNSIAGPDHCDWRSAVMMHLGWPLGTVSQSSAEIRQFIRDPDGVIGYGIRDKLVIAIDLPDDAQDTGYRNGELELWLSPSDPDAAYVRAADDVERWPRADPIVACR